MKVFFNTLFHGDKKTKILLWGCIVAGLATVGCLLAFIFTLKMPWIFGTIFSLLVPLFILRKYDFSDGDETPDSPEIKPHRGLSAELLRDATEAAKTLPPVERKDPAKKDDEKTGISVKTVTEPDEKPEKPEKKEKPEKPSKKANPGKPEKKEKPEKPSKKENPEKPEKKEKPEKSLKKDKPESPVKTEKKVKTENPVKPEKTIKQDEPEKLGEPEKKATAEPQLLDVDAKALKQILVKYKVRREHKPIIVDSSAKYKISQCPAYMWVNRKKLHILLLEQSPREISFDMSRTTKITYSREKASPATEYADIRVNRLLSPVFSQFIPTYREDYDNHIRTSFKNLYTIVDDIKLTNTSARAAFDMTKASFELPDKYNLPQTSGQYVREANKTKILWQDAVISTSEFKTRIKNLLEDMTVADIADREFDMNLHEMVSRQLITKEYADYYGNVRG